MDLKKTFQSLFEDSKAVSPIVATLVLVVVAIAGAAAVGTIMGSFSSDVSDSASAGDASAGASAELLVAGSTTVQPVSDLLAEKFMTENPGVKVTVQAGGSGAGKASTEMGIVDIGSASEPVDTVTEHPTLKVYQIGASAVVPIGNGVTYIYTDEATAVSDFNNLYKAANTNGVVDISTTSYNFSSSSSTVKVFQREEVGSGSEECFSKWATTSKTGIEDTNATMAAGNPGVLKAVQDTPDSVGFVDIGFTEDATGITILDVTNGKTSFKDVDAEVLKQLKGDSTSEFPAKLTRPLNYLTLGEPSALEQSFIDFALQPAQKGVFGDVGYYSMYDI